MRCKVVCTSKEDSGSGVNLAFWPVVDGSPENKQFFAATPAGSISLSVVNRDAANRIEAGQEYYIDFSPANSGAQVEKQTAAEITGAGAADQTQG